MKPTHLHDTVRHYAMTHHPNAMVTFLCGSHARNGAVSTTVQPSDVDLIFFYRDVKDAGFESATSIIHTSPVTDPDTGRTFDVEFDTKILDFDSLDLMIPMHRDGRREPLIYHMLSDAMILDDKNKDGDAIRMRARDVLNSGPTQLSKPKFDQIDGDIRAIAADLESSHDPLEKMILGMELYNTAGNFGLLCGGRWGNRSNHIYKHLDDYDMGLSIAMSNAVHAVVNHGDTRPILDTTNQILKRAQAVRAHLPDADTGYRDIYNKYCRADERADNIERLSRFSVRHFVDGLDNATQRGARAAVAAHAATYLAMRGCFYATAQKNRVSGPKIGAAALSDLNASVPDLMGSFHRSYALGDRAPINNIAAAIAGPDLAVPGARHVLPFYEELAYRRRLNDGLRP